jgi:hypothetical protein
MAARSSNQAWSRELVRFDPSLPSAPKARWRNVVIIGFEQMLAVA